MAEDTEQSSKTEEPTQRRLEEARKRGDVARSPEAPAFLALAAASGVVLVSGGWMSRSIAEALLPFIAHPDAFDLKGGGGQVVLQLALKAALPGVVILAAAAAGGAFGNIAQTGFLWSPDRLAPKLDKVSPMEGFKRLFGVDGLVQFLKSALKLIAVGVITWMIAAPRILQLQFGADLSPAAILPVAVDILRALIIAVLCLMAAIAAADLIWQRQRWMARLRMTREELKQDMKDSDGDPHTKARRRRLMMQRARQRMMQAVPKATVVITNPTHYAVALRYIQGETAAPVCVAKGVDKVALRIRAVAGEHEVPIIEDPPLARALYAAMEIDDTIPREHYEAVAKIIGHLLSRRQRRAPAPAPRRIAPPPGAPLTP
jgi:flagellar biosynthetic protein FlhB